MPDVPAWWNDPAALEELLPKVLGDVTAVEAILLRLAVLDPVRAQRCYDDLRTALQIAQGGKVEARLVPVVDDPV